MDGNNRPLILLNLLFTQGKVGDEWDVKALFYHWSDTGFQESFGSRIRSGMTAELKLDGACINAPLTGTSIDFNKIVSRKLILDMTNSRLIGIVQAHFDEVKDRFRARATRGKGTSEVEKSEIREKWVLVWIRA